MSANVPEAILDAIRAVVGSKGWIADAGGMERYLVEERGLLRGSSAMVVLPASTGETAKVVGLCAEAGVPGFIGQPDSFLLRFAPTRPRIMLPLVS